MDYFEPLSLGTSIQSWLDTIACPAPQNFADAQGGFVEHPRLDWDNMPTPPQSSTPTQQGSPTKRARVEEYVDDSSASRFAPQLPDSDDLFDVDKTPNASTRSRNIPLYNLSTIPHLRQTPSQSSASSNRSLSRTSTSRSASPVKRSTLELLKKPLYYVPILNDPTEQLPKDVISLYDKVISITVHRENFLPRSLRTELENMHRKGTIRPAWYHDVDREENNAEYAREFSELCALQEAAQRFKSEKAAEIAWNSDIHNALLSLAFKPFSSLRRDLLVTARISKPFLPKMQDATIYDYTRAKMVDLGVGIRPSPRIADKIDQILISLPYSHQCINQTVYGPVRKNPLVMVIETKLAEGDLEEARLQLGVWVASWHQRIAVLFGGHLAGKPVITLPLIIVMEHQWRLLLACDRMDRLEVLEEIPMGGTDTLVGLYTIVATLRAIGSWAEEIYMPWLEHMLDCLL